MNRGRPCLYCGAFPKENRKPNIELEVFKHNINQAIGDFKWIESNIPGSNFQASIIGLNYCLKQLGNL